MTETARPTPRSAVEPMKAERVQARVKALRGWKAVKEGRALMGTFELLSPEAASRFASFVAGVSRELGANPELTLHMAQLTVTTRTATAGGVTELDFELAEWIDPVRVE